MPDYLTVKVPMSNVIDSINSEEICFPLLWVTNPCLIVTEQELSLAEISNAFPTLSRHLCDLIEPSHFGVTSENLKTF